jgi:3-carboxy-cis,cis-muconate cycloisomerase
MSIHIMDSEIYGDDFASPPIREIFTEKSIVEDWLHFEVVLAEVQAEMGWIPLEAAREIKAKGSLEHVKLERITALYRQTMLSSVALIRAFKESCEHGAGEYIHYGATTQDLFDTTLTLRLKKVLDIFESDLRSIQSHLNGLAEKHRHTLMAGRTHGQQALPITFGFKMAIGSDMVRQHRERLREARKRILVGSVCGAVGNFASFHFIGGEKCLEMEKKVLERLGLPPAGISLQPQVERLAEFLNLLSLLTMTFEKFADEIFLLQRNEFAELEEPFDSEKQISSSTMPQKRNPNRCELVKALSKKIRSNALAFSEIHMRDERDHAPFYLEDLILPETCILASTLLNAMNFIFSKLVVKKEAMRNNLALTQGLIMAEPLMLALARKTGQKEKGLAIVHKAAMESFEKGIPFGEVLGRIPEIQDHFTEEELRRLLKPENYLGLNDFLIDRVVQQRP